MRSATFLKTSDFAYMASDMLLPVCISKIWSRSISWLWQIYALSDAVQGDRHGSIPSHWCPFRAGIGTASRLLDLRELLFG